MLTVVFDESGPFEQRQTRVADIIGGLIVPGNADDLAKLWQRKLVPIRQQFGDRLHANELGSEARHAAYAKTGPITRESRARWLFLIDPPSQDTSAYVPFARSMRMLDAYVDLAARLAAAWGATDIDARPAQRTLAIDRSNEARLATELGLALESGQVAQGTSCRGITEADVRVTRELLSQHGACSRLASVRVANATACSSDCLGASFR